MTCPVSSVQSVISTRTRLCLGIHHTYHSKSGCFACSYFCNISQHENMDGTNNLSKDYNHHFRVLTFKSRFLIIQCICYGLMTPVIKKMYLLSSFNASLSFNVSQSMDWLILNDKDAFGYVDNFSPLSPHNVKRNRPPNTSPGLSSRHHSNQWCDQGTRCRDRGQDRGRRVRDRGRGTRQLDYLVRCLVFRNY